MPAPVDLRFCSIADAKFVPQAIVLHRSLRAVLPDAELEVLCMDPLASRTLEALALPGLVPVPIAALEERDPALPAVREGRSTHEYSMTSKPTFCADMLRRHPDAAWVMYLDSDTMFFSDPAPVFDELRGASVGIVGHRFAPEYAHRAGWATPYCAFCVSFAQDDRGNDVANWWRERCLEWCFHRVEGDRLSDQGYLRDLPERFDGVHVLQHPGIGPAPWTRNDGLARSGDRVTVDGEPLVVFHHQSLRVHRRSRLPSAARPLEGAPVPFAWRINPEYRLSAAERELVWEPYLERLAEALRDVHGVAPELLDELQPPDLRATARAVRQRVWMRRNAIAHAMGRSRTAR